MAKARKAQARGRGKREGKGLLAHLIARCSTHLAFSAFFALLVDILYLSSPIYLINVYNRVLSSGSRGTLVMLSIALVFALLALVLLDDARARLLMRMGVRIDREVAKPLMETLLRENSRPGVRVQMQAVRDLDNFRQVITGPGIMVFFNAPWVPIFAVVLYMLHPLLCLEACIVALILLLVAVGNEFAIRYLMGRAATSAQANYALGDEMARNAEVVLGMGMEKALIDRWGDTRSVLMANQMVASGRASVFSAVTKFLHFGAQALVVATAVWLILDHQVSPGVIFPAMLLLGRTLTPVEQIVNSWKSLLGARHSFGIVAQLLERDTPPVASVPIDRADGALSAERIVVTLPGRERPILRNVNFDLGAGQTLGIVGANGSGKSTLARALIGVWPPTAGTVRLDGADVSRLNRDDVRRLIGYMPQDVQLLSGTVGENIARFLECDPAEITEAARRTYVHEQILRLPQGYDTEVGDSGGALSAGMRQRIGLARALFRDPQLIVLDEPNSNLDAAAEVALMNTLRDLRELGRTVILIAHRPSLMTVADQIMVLSDGAVDMLGPRAEILAKVTRPAAVKVAQAKAGDA